MSLNPVVAKVAFALGMTHCVVIVIHYAKYAPLSVCMHENCLSLNPSMTFNLELGLKELDNF